MKFVEALAFVSDALENAAVPNAKADAYWLICYSAGISKGELMHRMSFDLGLQPEQTEALMTALGQRLKRVPLQHITGRAAFRMLELSVGPGVFIPRPETEGVAQLGIDYLNSLSGDKVALDIGSGSGAIALALATEVPDVRVIAVEASEEAAAYTARNIQEWAPAVELRVGEFQDRVLDLAGQLDLVISNPPYIPTDAVPLDPEVRDHDPDLALYGGSDGLDLIREIIQTAPVLLKVGGMLVLEHADGQSDAVCQLLLDEGFAKVSAQSDLAQRLRSVTAIR